MALQSLFAIFEQQRHVLVELYQPTKVTQKSLKIRLKMRFVHKIVQINMCISFMQNLPQHE